MAVYRKIPDPPDDPIVEADQFDLSKTKLYPVKWMYPGHPERTKECWMCVTENGLRSIELGDWLIKQNNKIIGICKKDDFSKKYETVPIAQAATVIVKNRTSGFFKTLFGEKQ